MKSGCHRNSIISLVNTTAPTAHRLHTKYKLLRGLLIVLIGFLGRVDVGLLMNLIKSS